MSARILLFTGKGGVGKTTVAAATALQLAAAGHRTLLLSTDAADSLADTLGVTLGLEPEQIHPELWSLRLDTQHRLEVAWSQIQDYLLHLLARSGVDPVTAQELTVLPGLDEVLALLAVREFAESGRWDVLVLDCAPTAETLRLLALPEALDWYLQKVLPAQRRLARGLRPLASLLGRGEALPAPDVFDAVLRLCHELAAVRAFLADPDACSVRLVLTPERVVVAETRRAFTALALYGYRVDQVIANRVFGADDEFRSGWAKAQQHQLREMSASFADVCLRQIEYAANEPIGYQALIELAQRLYDPADPGDLGLRSSSGGLTLEGDEREFRLRLPLPLADKSDVQAVRCGDDLSVTVAGNRRVLALPSVLRRCDVTGGDVADGMLVIRFAADPALWPRTEESA